MKSECVYLAQLSLGAVFALAAAFKLLDLKEVVRVVRDYDLLPEPLNVFVGFSVIPVEVALAAGHLTGRLLVVMAPIGTLVLGCFALAIGVNLARGRDISCGCFGRDSEAISVRSLARVLVLLLGELAVAHQAWVARPLLSASRPEATLTTFAVIWFPSVLLVLVGGMWCFASPEIVYLFRRRAYLPDDVSRKVGS